MTVYEANETIVNEAYLDIGDDVYMKDMPLDTATWGNDQATASPTVGTNIFTFTSTDLDTDTTYIVYKNVSSFNFTVDDYAGDNNLINAADILTADADTLVYFTGSDLPAGLTAGKKYWVINVVNGVSFEVEATQSSGTPVDLVDAGSGTRTYTLASRRSASDTKIGVIGADQSSLMGEGQSSRDGARWLQIQSDVTAILADTNELQTDWTDGGRLDAILDTIAANAVLILADTGELQTELDPTAVADAVWDELLAGHVTADSAGLLLNDWQDDGRLDVILDAIKAKTDVINSGVASTVDSDQTRVNITRNDSYDGTANAALSWTVTKDYTSGWTGTMTIRHEKTAALLLSKAVTITDATTLTVTLATADTAFAALTTATDFGPHPYDIEMEHSGGSKQTAIQGPAVISSDETTA